MFKKLFVSLLVIAAFNLRAQAADKVYIAAIKSNYPPFDFLDENGFEMGFDVDVLKSIAEKQGFTLEFVAKNSADIISGLHSGSYHIGTGGFTEGEEGGNLLSSPYFFSHDVVMTKEDVRKINYFSDLQGLTVTTQKNTVYSEDLLSLFADDSGKANLQNTSFLAFRELARGRADALLESRATSEYYASEYPNIKFVIHELKDERYKKYKLHMVISKHSPELREKINEGLRQMMNDGTYQKIYQKWFDAKLTESSH